MAENKKAFSILHVVSRLVSFATMVLALVMGFMYRSCNKDMSTWLLVYGFMTPIIASLLMIIICLALPGMVLAADDRSDEVVCISLCPFICCTVITVISIIIFGFAWIIYGAVLFFPAASGPYPTCLNGNDGKVLVITGTIIVALRIVFCFFPGFSIKRSQFSSDGTSSTSGTWNINRKAPRIEVMELEEVDIIEAGAVPHVLTDEAPEGNGYDIVEFLKTSGFVGLVFLAIDLVRLARGK